MSASSRILQRILALNQNPIQFQLIRWKGHSKWQNIKATKGANDLLYNKLSSKYASAIALSVKMNGMETNQERNKSLAR